jgi:ABC-type transporter MlaC component
MKKLFFLLALIGAAAAAAAAFKRDDVKSGAKKATDTVAKTAQQAQSAVKDKVAAEKVPTTISGPEAAEGAANN